MKILVCIKAVPEPEHVIEITKQGPVLQVDAASELRMNRFDEFAVEEAVLLKQSLSGTTVDAVTVGPENAQKAVKRAIGMGADAGIHIVADYATSCDAAAVSSLIAGEAGKNQYELILCGIMSEDMMQFSVGPMLARRLSLPWATSVTRIEVDEENAKIRVERELEGGIREMVAVRQPALLTIQSGINDPRYPSLSNMLRANADRIIEIDAASLTLPPPSVHTSGYAFPEKMRDGRVLEGTPEEKAEKLIKILKEKTILP